MLKQTDDGTPDDGTPTDVPEASLMVPLYY